MKNKLTLKILHFFGFCKDQYHFDDTHIKLPTCYSSNYPFRDDKWMINDIKDQVYRLFEKDIKLKEKCRIMKSVCVSYSTRDKNKNIYVDNMKYLFYMNDVLYFPEFDSKSLIRDIKLNEILNYNTIISPKL